MQPTTEGDIEIQEREFDRSVRDVLAALIVRILIESSCEFGQSRLALLDGRHLHTPLNPGHEVTVPAGSCPCRD